MGYLNYAMSIKIAQRIRDYHENTINTEIYRNTQPEEHTTKSNK